ncbi:MAG: hypothetical protein U9O98_01120 [Asgard group archaeon]|nr:hypothetical protein [Asgard group archaeon]
MKSLSNRKLINIFELFPETIDAILKKEKIERSEAILRHKINKVKGLQVRNEILKFLFKDPEKHFTVKEIANGIGFNSRKVYYHLENMLDDLVVNKEKKKNLTYWAITGLGQQTIKKWMAKDEK